VVAGQGNEIYEQALLKLKELHPGKLGVRLDLSPGLFHRVIAGADLLLMPSIEEPCGLTLMQALRYGTVPVARAVGGLKESMEPFPARIILATVLLLKTTLNQPFYRPCEKPFHSTVSRWSGRKSSPAVWSRIIPGQKLFPNTKFSIKRQSG